MTPLSESPDWGELDEPPAASEFVPLLEDDAAVDEADKTDEVPVVSRSVDWYTMRTPNAFRPPGLTNVPKTVLVMPSALVVIGSVEVSWGTHVQNRVLHTLRRVLVVTHERMMSAL